MLYGIPVCLETNKPGKGTLQIQLKRGCGSVQILAPSSAHIWTVLTRLSECQATHANKKYATNATHRAANLLCWLVAPISAITIINI